MLRCCVSIPQHAQSSLPVSHPWTWWQPCSSAAPRLLAHCAACIFSCSVPLPLLLTLGKQATIQTGFSLHSLFLHHTFPLLISPSFAFCTIKVFYENKATWFTGRNNDALSFLGKHYLIPKLCVGSTLFYFLFALGCCSCSQWANMHPFVFLRIDVVLSCIYWCTYSTMDVSLSTNPLWDSP